MRAWWVRLEMCAAIISVAALVCSLVTPANAAVDMYDGHLRWTFVPYLWFPTSSGTLNFAAPSSLGSNVPPGTTLSVSVAPTLNFGFLGYLEARKDNWSLFTDVVTLNLSNQKSTVAAFNVGQGRINLDPSFDNGTTSSFQTTLATLAASYTTVHQNMSTLDVFLGAQLASANATVNWSLTGPRGQFPQSGSASEGQTLVAGVVGIKGNVQLGGAESRWFLPYYFDVGAGGFSTYEAMAGIAYAFSWGDLLLTYRVLYLDMGSGGLVQSTTMSGPMFGVGFHW